MDLYLKKRPVKIRADEEAERLAIAGESQITVIAVRSGRLLFQTSLVAGKVQFISLVSLHLLVFSALKGPEDSIVPNILAEAPINRGTVIELIRHYYSRHGCKT